MSESLWLTGEESSQCRALREAVRQAVECSLTGKQREVVEGYFFEGLSQSQLAERLGVSQQVVHKRLYGVQRGGKRIGGALERLRRTLAPLVTR